MLFNNKKVLNNKLDIITIKDLNVYAFHGVSPEENKLGQTFFITAQLFTDTHKAGITDSLKETINYADVCHFINDYTKNHKLLDYINNWNKFRYSLKSSNEPNRSFTLELIAFCSIR